MNSEFLVDEPWWENKTKNERTVSTFFGTNDFDLQDVNCSHHMSGNQGDLICKQNETNQK